MCNAYTPLQERNEKRKCKTENVFCYLPAKRGIPLMNAFLSAFVDGMK